MESKRKIRPWHFVIGILLLVLLLILGTCTAGVFSPLPYRHLDSFRGKVIDTESKEPVEGAVVLAIYYKETYTVAGSNSWAVDAQEVMTDENGEFNVHKKRRWFALHRGYTEGKVTIFKPGYGTFPRHKDSKAVGENKTWPPPEKYVVYELPELKTKEERKENVIYIRRYNEISYSKREHYWKTINEERISLGLPPNTMTEKELKE